jgi:RimJ/RimL family protein N-acetyltransferase
MWAKMFCVDGTPVGVCLLGMENSVLTVSEILIDPMQRGKGYGSAALQELLAEGSAILGKQILSAKAVIYPDNIASQKAFEKAGFRFESAHPDGDAWYYRYDRVSFVPIDRRNARDILPRLFEILHGNMRVIAPTGNSYTEDEALWISCIAEALEKPARQLLLVMDGGAVAGFFMYYVNGNLWMMEEIQFAPAYQGSGLFQLLYARLFEILPDSVEYVEAYANKQNQKSTRILEHLGLAVTGENHNGNCYHFRGRYRDLREKLQG